MVDKKELDFELFYKALQPALMDFGIELDINNTKKLVGCILSLIGLFCYKNPDRFFKVGNLKIFRYNNHKKCVFTVNVPPCENRGSMRDKLQKQFNSFTISNVLQDLVKSYFETVVEDK